MGHEGAPTIPPENETETLRENEGLGIRAKVVLDRSRVGEDMPKGTKDETRAGFAFYEVGSDGKLSDEPFTMDMNDKPELVVVDEEDYRSLQDKKFIAKPVRFVWSTDSKAWSVEF